MTSILRVIALAAGVFVASVSAAQTTIKTENGDTAHLRALDTITGVTKDLDITVGAVAEYERLIIRVQECRFPKSNKSADAFAYLQIWDIREDDPRFEGWMVASSPALSAMDHPRYDVWLLSCTTTDG